MEVVADSSVISKWYVMERYSEESLKLRELYVTGKVSISAPCFMPFEVINAVRRANNLSKEGLQEIVRSLYLYGFRLYPLDYFGEEAAGLAYDSELDLAEASYLALALKRGVNLITADDLFYETWSKKFREVKHVSSFR
ncbi:hypothetical protein HS1genome_1637 [Sulfodiicoccus acidiphilus]|uniref:PIN domain-containing protein n=1 Tax=Sulfodiicoccus acidiphilus TaxID=1670455 RepID=A0A348B4Z6_9CREN|nr:type II toxin-antitoxin system VapC family toxin [Sulfodiicoccus acidiphilus]BBD73248.1 hypothetical protein HS1genome_1637 [Sulfodiicoccus acidiphilus]GGT89614.1 hypothetical protein GCM10007116_04330 [Sulfodiicoccus acidiphilus]